MATAPLVHGLYVRQPGHDAEDWSGELLQSAGYHCRRGTKYEDMVLGIDYWVVQPKTNLWLPIQYCSSRREIVGTKGVKALRDGIIPQWLPNEALEKWHHGEAQDLAGLGSELVDQFWLQVNAVLAIPWFYPREPDWEHWRRSGPGYRF